MNNINLFKKVSMLALITLNISAVALFCGCGSKTLNESGKNIVQTDGVQTEDGQVRNYDVLLDVRDNQSAYYYTEDDLYFVDTVSGGKIALGMHKDEIEAVCNAPVRTDRDTAIYDGIVVTYKDDTAVSISVSSGIFDGSSATRFKTSRGISVGMSHNDFLSVYGSDYVQGSDTSDDELIKTPSRATRYFKKDGKKYEYLGTTLTKEQERAVDENYFIQDFMFSTETGNIATMRVALYSEI